MCIQETAYKTEGQSKSTFFNKYKNLEVNIIIFKGNQIDEY